MELLLLQRLHATVVAPFIIVTLAHFGTLSAIGVGRSGTLQMYVAHMAAEQGVTNLLHQRQPYLS